MGFVTSIKRLFQRIFHITDEPLAHTRERAIPHDTVSPPMVSDTTSPPMATDIAIAAGSNDTHAVTETLTTPVAPEGSMVPHVVQAFQLVEDKIEHRGEDAPPICIFNEARGLIAVFDGMGGAGAKKYKNALNEEFTGAYLGSRFARNYVEHWYNHTYGTTQHQEITASELANLKQALVNELSSKLVDYTSPSTVVMSKMRRTLPSTMASIFFETSNAGCTYDVVWAGDSRAYRLHVDGLQQLTVDDTSDTGAIKYADFMQDSPLTNCISIDQEFHFNHQRFTSALPLILCVATDGCFGYVPSPIHFEHLLLDTLMHTSTPDEWALRIGQILKPIAADDYSMALICLGWTDFMHVQHSLQPRYGVIQRMVMEFDQIQATIQQVDTQIEHLSDKQVKHKARLEELFSTYWQNYRVPVEPSA